MAINIDRIKPIVFPYNRESKLKALLSGPCVRSAKSVHCSDNLERIPHEALHRRKALRCQGHRRRARRIGPRRRVHQLPKRRGRHLVLRPSSRAGRARRLPARRHSEDEEGAQDLAHAGPAHLSAALADGGEERARCEEAALGDRQIAQVCGNGRQRGRPRPRGTAPRRRGARALQGPQARRAILGFGGGPRLHPKRPRQARRQPQLRGHARRRARTLPRRLAARHEPLTRLHARGRRRTPRRGPRADADALHGRTTRLRGAQLHARALPLDHG